MARLIPLYLDPSAYGVVLGGPEVSSHLLKKQWGHSGSPKRPHLGGSS